MPNVTDKMRDMQKDSIDEIVVNWDSENRVTISRTDKGMEENEKRWKAYIEKMQPTCPEGYTVIRPGQTIDMLGIKELWRIHEKNPEPFLTRVPQDLVDTPFGPAAQRIPKEWGICLYYKTV
jgi:hypothetical protein